MILGIIDHDRGDLNAVSLEMLTLARDLAGKVNAPLEAVVVGKEGGSLTDLLQGYGVQKVHLVTHEALDEYAPEAWARGIVQLIEEASPQAVLAPGTDRGNEVLAHVAALAELPMAANCTEVEPGDEYEVTRVRWGGSLLEEARLTGALKCLSVAPLVVEAAEAQMAVEATVESFTPTLDEKAFRVRITERVDTSGDRVSLSDADVVVGGGRGVGSAEGFELLDELADLLNGAVGGSRVVTNLGWRPHADQIGQTGTRIAPELYIACGISGAIQHMVGAKGSKSILAVNTDREAPIMSKADYAVIGDLHEVLSALIAELKKRKGA